MKMTIVILGGSGLLGYDLTKVLSEQYTVFSFNSKELNLLEPQKVKNKLRTIKPDIVINSAAITNVDWAELNKDPALKVNAFSLNTLCEISRELECELYHISTDYVFNGNKNSKYKENDFRSSVNFYGYTKIMAEEIIEKKCENYKILRVAWLIGKNRETLFDKILKSRKKRIKIIDDQIGDPTFSIWVSNVISQMVEIQAENGIYNLTSSQAISRYEFAEILNNKYSLGLEIEPIKSNELSRPALRPKNSSLDNKKITSILNLKQYDLFGQMELYDKQQIK